MTERHFICVGDDEVEFYPQGDSNLPHIVCFNTSFAVVQVDYCEEIVRSDKGVETFVIWRPV